MITEKILVVDDEETVCQSIKKILTRRGYTVDNALSAEEAIKKINEFSYDLVITDLMMPKTNGIELIQIIKGNYPELDVVMITGYASIESAVKATKLGAINYIPKPFTPDELTKITDNILSQRKVKLHSKKDVSKENISDEKIDVDLPFSEKELTKATSSEYVSSLTHSDIPLASKTALKAYCNLGKRECRRLVLEGRECIGECPITKKEKAQAKRTSKKAFNYDEILDVDLPFNAKELEKFMDSDYINCMSRSDIPLAGLYGRTKENTHNALVVDDEPIVCHSVRRILAKNNITVTEAFDVDVALQKMKLGKYDLVILDLKMPKKSGLEVLQTIKSNWPNLPVILISGYATIENAIEAIKLGAYDVVPKPFTPEELSKKAEEILAS